MKKIPLFLWLPIVLGVFAVALGGYAGWQKFHPNTTATLTHLELPDVDKKLRYGNEWLGKVVLVNHWATWCPPCREEIPRLIEAQQRFGARGLQIVGIAHDLLETTRAYGDSVGLNYPSLVAIVGGRELMQQHGNARGALPFTALFDRNGNLVHTKLGVLSSEEINTLIAPLL